MKRILLAVSMIALAGTAQAQATSGSASAAQAQSGAVSGSASGAQVVLNQNYAAPNPNQRQQVAYSGDYEVKSAPNVQAPAVFGGGHPCLAGKSGGFSVVGGGLSYGEGKAEAACMAMVLGQPEVAIRIMASQSPAFCKAINNVGYYRVGNSVVPFQCGKQTKRGGVDTVGVASTTTVVSTRSAPAAQWRKCEFNAAANKITWKPKGNKAVSKAACLSHLGY